jgi:hypothetical protein
MRTTIRAFSRLWLLKAAPLSTLSRIMREQVRGPSRPHSWLRRAADRREQLA